MNPDSGTGPVKSFLVPDLGEGLQEVTLSGWNVAVGDRVALNQVLCSVETAKAEVEIPSPYPGRVVELGGQPGDVLAVGAVLVRIDTEAAAPGGPPNAPGPVLVGYGADDALDISRRVATGTGRPRAEPAARKLAAELGVDLHAVAPGPGGVITRAAVRAAAGSRGAGADGTTLPPTPVQSAMAERMTLSRSKIPDAHASVEVDCTALLQLRDRLRAGAAGESITPFVLILRLLVSALTRHRVLNSTWVDAPGGPQVRTHADIHLGLAVAAPRGLLVPVIAEAHTKTTRELAECTARLIRDAHAGVLPPQQLRGSTFTVSNFGALGLDDGVPVINYPEAAILGMGSLRSRPAVRDGVVVARPQLNLTCVFDHRVADGAQVAGLLCELRDLIESPDTALLDL